MKLKLQGFKQTKLNYRILLVVLVISVGIGFFLIRVFAATPAVYLTPGTSSVFINNTFTVQIRENSGTTAVNAVQTNFSYPTNLLTFVSIDTTGSPFTVAGPSGNTNGVVSVVGGIIGQVTGDQLVATVTFKANSIEGMAILGFTGSTAVIDAVNNRDIVGSISNTAGGVYTIKTSSASDTTPPTQPTGLSGSALNTSQIKLNWNASSDNVGVTGYDVYRNGFKIATVSSTTYTDIGRTAGFRYQYYIKAKDAAGNVSVPSAVIYVTASPTSSDTTPPSSPTGLTATPSGSNQVNLSWSPSTDNVGVAGYNILRSGVKIATTSTSSYSDTTVSPSSSYSYTVSAYDAAGNTSAQSNNVFVTTSGATVGNTSVSGNVAAASTYQNIPGAKLSIKRYSTASTAVISTTYTDANGHYSFTSLPGGASYQLTVSANGYTSLTRTFYLYANTNRVLNLYLSN